MSSVSLPSTLNIKFIDPLDGGDTLGLKYLTEIDLPFSMRVQSESPPLFSTPNFGTSASPTSCMNSDFIDEAISKARDLSNECGAFPVGSPSLPSHTPPKTYDTPLLPDLPKVASPSLDSIVVPPNPYQSALDRIPSLVSSPSLPSGVEEGYNNYPRLPNPGSLSFIDLPESGVQLHMHQEEGGSSHFKRYGEPKPFHSVSAYDAAMSDIIANSLGLKRWTKK